MVKLDRDLNCLSYWYPKIKDLVPTPKTIIQETNCKLIKLLDNEEPQGFKDFVKELKNNALKIGYPLFLRTGHGSGKHEWENTCYVSKEKDLISHVASLVEWSCLVDFFGLPVNIWVLRELLPTTPFFTAFGNMPICREFRCFVKNSKVFCVHPYWPLESFRKITPKIKKNYSSLCSLSDVGKREISGLASMCGDAVKGHWSVDVLDTERGWYVIDMARADMSYHWKGCKNEKAD